jgi:hypothetical protein
LESKIHKDALPRIAEQPDGDQLMRVFLAMVEEGEAFGNDVQQVCLPFIDEGDEFVEGTWVPEFWFVIRKVLPDEASTDQL